MCVRETNEELSPVEWTPRYRLLPRPAAALDSPCEDEHQTTSAQARQIETRRRYDILLTHKIL